MRTQDARSIHINDYLNRIGARFARTQNGTNGLEYVYHSPIREDRDPSLCVNFDRNIWYDAPSQRGGRLIELVCYLNELPETNVSGALKILDQIFPQYRGSGHSSASQNHFHSTQSASQTSKITPSAAPTSLKKKGNGRELIAEREIYWYPLKSYLEERKIPLSLAKIYLKEVEYRSEQRVYKALGWKAGNTYVLRNKHFKGFLDTGAQVTVIDRGSTEIIVFEGFFDFLSYLVIQKQQKSPLTAVILNSTAMYSQLKRFLAQGSNIERLSCYFDRDEAGRSLMEKIESDFGSRMIVSDCSSLYKNFHDLNEMLVSS